MPIVCTRLLSTNVEEAQWTFIQGDDEGDDNDYDDGWKGEHIPLAQRLRHGRDSIKKINSVRLVDLTKW